MKHSLKNNKIPIKSRKQTSLSIQSLKTKNSKETKPSPKRTSAPKSQLPYFFFIPKF